MAPWTHWHTGSTDTDIQATLATRHITVDTNWMTLLDIEEVPRAQRLNEWQNEGWNNREDKLLEIKPVVEL